MNFLKHVILPIIFISLSIYGFLNPLKARGTFRIRFKNEKERILFNRIYGVFMFIGSILYSILSIRVLLNQVEVTSFESFLIIILMALGPIPFTFLIYLIIKPKIN